jgi:UTP--glucose-1-phosphate uridylyltransferase
VSDITKAVVLVAGMGTRLLPATKSQPKEMLPVGRKPAVQYVVEELAHAGIEEVLFVTGRSKRSIEDHFDRDDILIERLVERGRLDVAQELTQEALDLRFFYTRQSVPLGTADAVRKGREFVGDQPFVVALGDSIIKQKAPAKLLQRMLTSHRQHRPSITIAVEKLPREDVVRYGVVTPRGIVDDEFEIVGIVEKPSLETAPSDLALAGRYIFEPVIFEYIERTAPSADGELLLPDSMRLMMNEGLAVRAVRLIGDERRYDIGNFHSYYEAFIDFALEDHEFGEAIGQYLRQKLSTRPPGSAVGDRDCGRVR